MTHFDLGPKPSLGYTASTLDRAAEKRHDAAFFAALQGDAATRAYLASGESIVLRKSGDGFDPLFTLADAKALGPDGEAVFLGLARKSGRLGLSLAADALEPLKTRDDLAVRDLRAIATQGLVAPEHLPVLAEAKSLLNWHARHRYCANCGAPTRLSEAGLRRDCAACAAQHFPRTDPVVIMLPVRDDHCLLGRAPRFIPNMWSCLAGYIEPGETIEDAVRREIFEEAGIVTGRVRYLASQPWPFPSTLMIGCHTQALSEAIVVDRTELEDARWFSRAEAARMLMQGHPEGLSTPNPVAIAHHIIRDWVEKGAAALD
ncbi:MAG: NAD(+) diphosphatase [Pseudorhodoplanes sp.]